MLNCFILMVFKAESQDHASRTLLTDTNSYYFTVTIKIAFFFIFLLTTAIMQGSFRTVAKNEQFYR